MKTKVIIASALTVLSLGIATSVFATSNQTEEKPAVKSSIQKSEVTEVLSVNETTKEAPVETVEVVEQTLPEAPIPTPSYLSKDEVTTKIVTSVSEQWNPKESGVNIGASRIHQLLLRSYDSSPEAFTESSTPTIIKSCIDKIKTLNFQEAQVSINSETCL